MNYKDDILENKAFNFFKQLMYNIALAICIMLVGVLILIYGFDYKLYEILSNSQAPYYVKGDMVVVKAQDSYEVGDIITFDWNGLMTTHRLIAVVEEDGQTYYVCHGDNVQNADRSYSESGWEDDRDYINSLLEQKTLQQIKSEELAINIQTPTFKEIEGLVLTHIGNYGTYLQFIKKHTMLLIAIIGGIWCVSGVIQNEIDIKRSRRLF